MLTVTVSWGTIVDFLMWAALLVLSAFIAYRGIKVYRLVRSKRVSGKRG